MHTFSDITLGVDMKTGRPKYDPAKWVFSHVGDRRKYTQADPLAGTRSAGYTGTEVEYCPGAIARNWENDAYSPLTKLLYTHTDNSCAMRILSTGDYRQGEGYTQRAAEDAGLARTIGLDGKPTTVQSELKAFDPAGRRIAWSMPVDDNSRTPQMATAGGLIFKGLNGKNQLVAIDAANGKVVWTFRTGSRFTDSPISYLYAGKQYIAVIASASPFNNAVRVDGAPDNGKRYRRAGTTLYVFKLPG
jgi:outer membrane protein assembly factor BamB